MRRKIKQPKPQWAARLTSAFADAGYVVERTADREMLGEIFRVHQMTIKSWTDGRTEPSYKSLAKVHEITEISLDWILCVPGARPHVIGRIPHSA